MAENSINRQNQRAYSAIAHLYAGSEPAEDDPGMRKHCRELFTGALKGTEVLEVGCGPGVDAHFLAQAGLKVTATDFCDEFVAIVGARFPAVTARKMDMTAPDFPEASFDGVYGFASFIHLPRALAAKTLTGLRKLLRPDGVLFLGLLRSRKVREYVIENWGGQPDNPMLFTCYDPEEIKKLLLEAGFARVDAHPFPSSKIYETMPRLLERGVSGYLILAFV